MKNNAKKLSLTSETIKTLNVKSNVKAGKWKETPSKECTGPISV